MRPIFISALALAALFACEKAPAPPEAPPSEPEPVVAEPGVKAESASAPAAEPAQESAPASPQMEFDEMMAGERMEYMKSTVLPKMKAVFQAGDPKEFAEVNCKTCHGSRAEKGNFKMPNEEILPLDASDGFADEAKAHPAMMKFMGEKVVPEMAALLGESPYNPETHEGFGCFGCHTKAEAKPAAKKK